MYVVIFGHRILPHSMGNVPILAKKCELHTHCVILRVHMRAYLYILVHIKIKIIYFLLVSSTGTYQYVLVCTNRPNFQSWSRTPGVSARDSR